MIEEYISEHRRTHFKASNQFSPAELRRRREEAQNERRQQRRDQILAGRHGKQYGGVIGHEGDTNVTNMGGDEVSAVPDTNTFIKELPQILHDISSDQAGEQVRAIARFRTLRPQGCSPVNEGIETEVVKRFVQLLRSPDPQVQFECAWALTNILPGSAQQNETIINAGAVYTFVELLGSGWFHVREQAVWALGKIASDTTLCNVVLGAEALPPLLQIIKDWKRKSTLYIAVWALSNLCRNKNPRPSWNTISLGLPAALAWLIDMRDERVQSDTCWAVSHFCHNVDNIQAIIDARIPGRLVELLADESVAVQKAALRSIGNIFAGEIAQAQAMIDEGALPALLPLLNSAEDGIRKDACWAISNIAAGSSSQIQAIIDAGLIPLLINVLVNGDPRSRKEACWAVSNAISGGLQSPDQIRYLVSQGCIKPFCDLLIFPDNEVIQLALDGLGNILAVGNMETEASQGQVGVNCYAVSIEQAEGMEKIQDCQHNANEQIYRKAYDIITKYFDEDEGRSDVDAPRPL